jgi:hypothetical protein
MSTLLVQVTIFVQITTQLAMLLSSVVVTQRRFSAAHNQLVSIRMGLNTARTHASLTKEKPRAAAPLLVPREESK